MGGTAELKRPFSRDVIFGGICLAIQSRAWPPIPALGPPLAVRAWVRVCGPQGKGAHGKWYVTKSHERRNRWQGRREESRRAFLAAVGRSLSPRLFGGREGEAYKEKKGEHMATSRL